MRGKGERSGTETTGRRVVLLGVATLLCAAAALAIGILLFGDFGDTEGRILGTTAVLAGYGLLALPAAILFDRRRQLALATAIGALAIVAAALAVTGIWADDRAPDAVGKSMGTASFWLVAAVQVAALLLRRHERDPRLVQRLFAVSSGVAVALAAVLTIVVWGEIDSEAFARGFGALLVLDALLVALQPIVARARPTGTPYRLQLGVGPEQTVELSVEAPDLAAAAAQAIRTAERDGHTVLWLSLVLEDGSVAAPGAPPLSAR